jgi:hypothetical protein
VIIDLFDEIGKQILASVRVVFPKIDFSPAAFERWFYEKRHAA